MPENPTASILMLTYNHGPYIRRAIESILNQKVSFPFELLIGEDCSTDNTREIAFEYQRKFPELVRVITSDKNVGARANSRRIEQACRGRYVAYCEGDDYWHAQEKLEKQVLFLESNPDYAMVHSDFCTFHIGSAKVIPRSLGLESPLNDSEAFNEILSGRRIVMTLTVCIRRSVWQNVLNECSECYDARFLMGDTQRWLEIARRGKIKYFPEVLATHLLLPESATQSKDPRKVLKFSLSAKDVLDHYIQKYGCPETIRRAAFSRSAIQILSCAHKAGDATIADGVLAEYRKFNIAIPLESHLFAFGSRRHRFKGFLKFAIIALDICRRIRRRLNRILKPFSYVETI